ncbi:MAG: bifunctional 3-deoxy-7-phosphoheptulonate synthase/chorismate mutase type II [Saprospiraceae bacterium]|nr:bifunctional 3-deoxy-7-phosphoheptulonate synthase/chorismate mutase type II [Saprospiraceae bacterium]
MSAVETAGITKVNWLNKEGRPVMIAGPCSVETEEQMIQTAVRLKATGKVDILRGGIWKPRTRPGMFEGIGAKGLPWMQKAKELTGLPITVEVAKASHVELALEFGVDVLWVGARTTVNPFSVQEVADALRGVDIPVLVKNPINPDLALWLGGIERLQKVGIDKIGGIHRGFSNASEKVFRNRPQWQLAIDFKTAMPELPLINDPSHICGRRDLLSSVAQKAMDLDFDGLMIESHITPDEAWSDAKQQITPEVYGELISRLNIRKHGLAAEEKTKLDQLRKDIDLIDEELIHVLSSRMKVAREIGQYKKDHNLTILQSDRWMEVLAKFVEKANNNHLSEEFITKVIKAIHDESISQQEDIING